MKSSWKLLELNMFFHIVQTLESGLAVRVAALLQQRVSLSMENSKLKQEIARLQQQKLIMERKLLYLFVDFYG
jgi:cell division protein FtsB